MYLSAGSTGLTEGPSRRGGMAYTADLKSVASACGFESHRRYERTMR